MVNMMEKTFRFKKVAAVLVVALMLVAAGSVFAASVTSDSPLGTMGVGKAEVSLGDLVADAMRSTLGTDFAFVSASELKEKEALAKGKVTSDDIKSFIAFTDDPIVSVRLTGRQVRLALERSVTIYPQKNLGFLQVSGLRFTFNPDEPQESRVVSVTKDGKQIGDNEVYTVAMTSSMANGALGYWKIWSKNDANKTDITIPQAVEQFLSGKASINYSALNRITVSE